MRNRFVDVNNGSISQDDQDVVLLRILGLVFDDEITVIVDLLDDIHEVGWSIQCAILDSSLIGLDHVLDSFYFWVKEVAVHGEAVTHRVIVWRNATKAVHWETLVTIVVF